MKRAVAVFLALVALCIFVCGPLGQSANALVGVDDAVIAIIVAALAACGITFVTSGAYATVSDYVEGLLSDYAESVGLTPQQVIYGIDYGRTELSKLVLNNKFVRVISALVTYIKTRFSIANNSVHSIQAGGHYLGSLPLTKLPIAFVRYNTQNIDVVVFESSMDCYVANVGSGLLFISRYPVTVHCTNTGLNKSDYFTLIRQPGPLFVGWNSGRGPSNPKICYYGTNSAWYTYTNVTAGDDLGEQQAFDTAISAIDNFDSVTDEASLKINAGAVLAPEEDPRYNPGDGAILDVGASWGTSLPDITDGTIPGEFSDGNIADPSIEYDSEETLQEEVTDAGEPTVSTDAEDYKSPGMQNVFPFCIPFDVYNLLSALAAEPEAPAFTWRFYVPRICDETFTVDLSAFDTVAQIVRTMELLAFIVGLAVVTRDKFIRG